MEPKIVKRAAFTVVGMKYHGKNENNDIPQMWGQFGSRVPEIKHRVDPHVAYGVCDNFDESSGEFDYIAGFEVDSTADIPGHGKLGHTGRGVCRLYLHLANLGRDVPACLPHLAAPVRLPACSRPGIRTVRRELRSQGSELEDGCLRPHQVVSTAADHFAGF